MTTTREAALEAALTLARNRLQACAIDHPTGSREMAERSEWADEATAALSTPATEPQGYMAGLEAACTKTYDTMCEGFCTEVPTGYCDKTMIADCGGCQSRAALAARPAPQPAAEHEYPDPLIAEDRYEDDQPAADTRVVPLALLTEAQDLAFTSIKRMRAGHVNCNDLTMQAEEYVGKLRAIIGTPAPSDKIAEAARVLLDAPGDVMTGFAIDVMRANRLRDGKRIGYQPAIISALRALAGKGE